MGPNPKFRQICAVLCSVLNLVQKSSAAIVTMANDLLRNIIEKDKKVIN